MSIANEITRMGNAKTAIASAIKEKGVAVPSGTKLDGMAPLIGQIQQGSSLQTALLETGSAVGGYTYYTDENGQGQRYWCYDSVKCLKGSYFIVDYAYSIADGFMFGGCELIQAYGPTVTTVNDGDMYVLIFKVTGDTAWTML